LGYGVGAQQTIFNQLSDAGISWGIYYPGYVSLTVLMHFGALHKEISNFHSLDTFYSQAAAGTLPQYSFVEPLFTGDPSDYHPSDTDNDSTNHSSIIAGEQFLKEVYDAIRTSPDRDNTLLAVTFDESGGLYDHMPPPSSGVQAPDNSTGEMNFTFNRLGMRVPTIFINSYIENGTIISKQLQHTSFMRMLRTLFNISTNKSLTNRDRTAPDAPLNQIFGNTLRSWPLVTARNVTMIGNFQDGYSDDLSFFVYTLSQSFDGYLSELKCTADSWFNGGCSVSSASSFGISGWVITLLVGTLVAIVH